MRLSRVRNILIGACLYASGAFGQHEQCPRPAAAPAFRGSVGSSCLKVVDGASHPQEIPETVAFRMFYRALAQPANATPEQIDMQRALVSSATLSESDLKQLFWVMADYRASLDNLRHNVKLARQLPKGVDEATAQRLTAERDQIVEQATANLTATLSKEGMAHLHELILSERKNMAIYSSPESSGTTTGVAK